MAQDGVAQEFESLEVLAGVVAEAPVCEGQLQQGAVLELMTQPPLENSMPGGLALFSLAEQAVEDSQGGKATR